MVIGYKGPRASTYRKPTPRQRQLLQLASVGYHGYEIGTELSIAYETVKNQFSELYYRIGARNRSHAVAMALREGWIE